MPWYHEGLAFECTQCGGCCSGAPGFVWVEDWEIEAIAKAMNYDDLDAFESKFVRQVGDRKSLVEYPDGDCIFLDPQSRGCLVYHQRPVQCRTWPFWDSNLESPRTWARAAKGCPGCNQGKVYSLDHIESQRLARKMD
ncbi:MAG: YkgJ family cysteine cluster protein [Pirellulales bacterium]